MNFSYFVRVRLEEAALFVLCATVECGRGFNFINTQPGFLSRTKTGQPYSGIILTV